jgi:ATP-binding cassette, subfamily C, bacterial LapB
MTKPQTVSTGINVIDVSAEDIEKFSSAEHSEQPKINITSHEEDLELAGLLTRLAALQGYAVPKHRFSMMSETAGGGVVEKMHRELKAIELWLAAIPAGEAYALEGEPVREHMPALWVSFDSLDIKLVRGILSSGGFGIENADGSSGELSPSEALDGRVLILRPEIDASVGPEDEPKSARDWFFYAIRKRKAPFIEAVFATGMVSMLALAASFYTMQVYDRVVPTQGYSTLTVLTVGTLIALSLELLMKHLRGKIVDNACKNIDQELSGVFFGRVLDIRMDARPKTIGTFAAQVKNFEMVRNFMTSSTLFLLADAPFVLFFIFVIASVGGWLALVPIALLPISIIAGFYAKWRMGKLAEQQMFDANKKNGLLVEAIDGIEAIKAVGGEWKMLDRWRHLTEESGEKELQIRSTTMMATNVTQSVQQLSYIFMIAGGVYAINSGMITQGALMACSIISNRALGPIAQISGMIVQWQHAKVALKGLDDMMLLPCDRPRGERMVIPERCNGELKLEAAGFSYAEGSHALKPTTLVIKPGERVAILGPVGSGKTTTIKLLSGLYRPSEGHAFLDGVDMAHLAPEFMREHIGYLTQDVRLFNGTLRDNLTMGLPSPGDAQILEAAKKSGLDRVIQGSSKGLELPIMEGGRGLSGGQRQLVGLTRLLIARPKLLLLDEPTASMDGDLEAFVMRNMVAGMASDAVLVLATHKMSLLKLVDRIVIMDRGQIVLDGPRDEIMRKLSANNPASNRPANSESDNSQNPMAPKAVMMES